MKTAVATVAILAASVTLAHAAAKTAIDVKPGPSVMFAEEKAIVADAAKGAQHGVILMEELVRNDDRGTTCEIAYHMRAKILSPEGRALADIEIPAKRGMADLKTWWGRTILPDGHVIDLPESELKAQTIVKSRWGAYQMLKGALPGVVPGCVVDFGWVVRNEGIPSSVRLYLQREWPVRSLRYRWVTSSFWPAAYAASRVEGRPIQIVHDETSVLVSAQNLDPVPEEPHMPPLDSARASVVLYYTNNDKIADFWEHTAKRFDGDVKLFVGASSAVKNALESAAIPAGAPLPEKLQLAYEWLGRNIKNTVLMSAEEEEAAGQNDSDTYNARSVLIARKATPRQFDYLFAGMARALGADASIVFAVDRTDRFWNKAFKSTEQFAYTFVAVRRPGAPDSDLVFVDAGSGLPYGQVPWQATGATALMCTAKGSVSILVPPASPATNRADTHATISFADDNETMQVKWARTANGATGMQYRRWLRDLDVRKRKETLDSLCGASGRIDVSAAELPGLDDVSAPYQIACDLEESDMNVDDTIDRYSLTLTGAWWPSTPEFPSETRVHPVIFDYPKVDILGIDVSAPHGFKPKDPPAPVSLETPYGRYQLVVAKTPTGFHVDRAFALTVLAAKTEEYAALRKFFEDVRKADATSIAFARETSAK